MPLKPLLLFLALLVLAPAAWCAKYTVMHSFSGGNDGEMLWGSLLLDTKATCTARRTTAAQTAEAPSLSSVQKAMARGQRVSLIASGSKARRCPTLA